MSFYDDERYNVLASDASKMKHPPRIVIARIDIIRQSRDYFEARGLEVESFYEYHLYDERFTFGHCSPVPQMHNTVVLGYQLGDIKVVDLEKYKEAVHRCLVASDDEYFDEKDGSPLPYRLIHDEIEGQDDEIVADASRKTFLVWDFKDNSSDDTGYYDGEYQWNFYKEALEDGETLKTSLEKLYEQLWEECHCNNSFIELGQVFPQLNE